MKLPFFVPLAAVMLLPFSFAEGVAQAAMDDPNMEAALRVLATTPLIDGHNDLVWQIRNYSPAPMDVGAYEVMARGEGQTDIRRLRAGRVGGQFWSVYVPGEAIEEGAARYQLEQIDIALDLIGRFPEHLELALTADEVVRIFHEGKIASLLGMEGGHAIENSLGALRAFHALGARYLTLTHNADLDWADAHGGAHLHGGLTAFGREVVREMNRLGMLVDLSHTSDAVMSDALDVTEAPVIFSHSSARALHDHTRNVPDSILHRLADNGGVIMITFVPMFLTDRSPATMGDVADHIEHVRDLIGTDHVGIGGDFDGIATLPEGLEDVATYPHLLAELSRRGWTESELRKVAGENVLRVMRDAENVARRLQNERPPSTATIEEMDGG